MQVYNCLVIILGTIAFADAKVVIHLRDLVDWYNCAGKPDGNYLHPSDCTRYMSCSNELAYEMDCAICNIDPISCPSGRLVYNQRLDACLPADQTDCETEESVGSTTVSTTESRPTEPSPTTPGRTTTTESRPTEPSPTDPSPTDPSPTTPGTTTTTRLTTTPEASTTPPPTQEGDPCNPHECVNAGYCQSYLRCDMSSETWVQEECGGNLVWNPLNPNGTLQIHGGNCDRWENLLPETQQEYQSDPNCLACFWRAMGECESDYEYQPARSTTRNVLRLSCAEGLVFSQEKETCQRCQDVRRSDGTTCC